MLEFSNIYCKHFVLKIYLRKKQLTTKTNIIIVKIDNLEIVNKIVIIAKIR